MCPGPEYSPPLGNLFLCFTILIPSLDCLPHSFWCSPAYSRLSGLHKHVADSCCLPSQNPFQQEMLLWSESCQLDMLWDEKRKEESHNQINIQMVKIIFKGALLKVDFSLRISCSIFTVDTCPSFIVFLQVADFQRRMENHIHRCIQHAVGGFCTKMSSFSLAEVSHSFKKQFMELGFRPNLVYLSCPDIALTFNCETLFCILDLFCV